MKSLPIRTRVRPCATWQAPQRARMARTPSSLESNENRKLLDRWDRHFRWSGAFLLGKTPIGRVTIPNDVDCALLLGADASRDPIAEAELVEDELETTNMGMTGTCALAPDWPA